MSFYISFEHIGGIEERHGRLFLLHFRKKRMAIAIRKYLLYNNILNESHMRGAQEQPARMTARGKIYFLEKKK